VFEESVFSLIIDQSTLVWSGEYKLVSRTVLWLLRHAGPTTQDLLGAQPKI